MNNMTKHYHITPERAYAIARRLDKEGFNMTTDTEAFEAKEFQAYANAVLDEVLGEPVADAFIDNFGDLKIYPTGIASKAILIRSGDTKLYAPRIEK